MEDDILVHQPTHAVIMLGMNDVNRSLYRTKTTPGADTLRRRMEAINTYEVNLEEISKILLSKNINVILEKPSIYDQTALLPTTNNYGVNDALKTCADYIKGLAKKYNLQTIDYWNIMSQINQEMQKNDPAATITGVDRVHPASTGHLVMAYEFLKSQGVPKYVSKIFIDENIDKSSRKSFNCKISSLSKSNNTVKFTIKEKALPFPLKENQQKGLELLPFMNDLNVELLKVNNLKSGQYQLSIDARPVGVFSDEQLRNGINLAELKDTPQYNQAMNVRDKLTRLWEMEAGLRVIKFIEYNPYFKSCPDKKNLAILKICLDSIFKMKYNNPYYNSQLAKYIENKPKESEFEASSDSLRREVYRMAVPSDHQFIISINE
jgi:endoglucanase